MRVPVGTAAFAIPPQFTVDFASRHLPGEITVTNAVPNPDLTFDELLNDAIKAFDREGTETALALIGEMRKRYPESALIHGLEAIVRERTGDLDAAVLGYRAALYLAPEISEFRFLLARALQNLGRTRGAIREYREVVTGGGSRLTNTTLVLGRLGVPDAEQMVFVARENLLKLESESQAKK